MSIDYVVGLMKAGSMCGTGGSDRLLSLEFWNVHVDAPRRLGQRVRLVEPTPTRIKQRNCEIRSLRLVLDDGTEEHVVAKDTRLQRAKFLDDVHYERTKRAYEVEIQFYEHLVKHLHETDARTAKYYYASASPDAAFLLVLEDLSRQCEISNEKCERHCQREQLDVAETKQALAWLADFHVAFLGVTDSHVWDRGSYWSLEKRRKEWEKMREEWSCTCRSFECHYPSTFSQENVRALAGNLEAAAERLHADLEPSTTMLQTMVHGDFKTANLFFLSQGVAVCDFQWTGPGLGVLDVIYLLYSSVQPSVVFNREQDLLYFYYERFAERAREKGLDVKTVYPWSDFKRHAEIAFLDFVRFSIGSMWGSVTPTSHERMTSTINLGMHRRNPDVLVRMVKKAVTLLSAYTQTQSRRRFLSSHF